MAGNAGFAGPSLLFLLIDFAASFLLTSQAQPTNATEVKVGLIIKADSHVGKIARTTISMALEEFYAAFPNSSARVQILEHDSGGDAIATASAALQLMTTEGARAILGPQSSIESAFVADLATRAEVPVVSFSATSPSVSPTTARFFARASLSDAAQAGAIAALATYFGWRRVVPIYQDDDYGAAFIPFLVDELTAARATVPYRCALPAAASPDVVVAALYRMESEQTRVFVLHTRAELAGRVFDAAVEAGMMGEGYAWVITDGLTGLIGFIKPPQGVIGLAPYVRDTPRLLQVRGRWAHRYMRDHPDADPAHAEMGCYAVWAYDAGWAVASAAERLSPSDLSSPPGLIGGKGGPTDISGLGKFMSGKIFLRAIIETKFMGLGGWFELIDGELTVPPFRVVNIMDNGKERGLGFWTQQYGLSRHVDRPSKLSGGELKPVFWPGDSIVRPSGWVRPTSERKLQVAVPGNVSDSYRPIVYLDLDPLTNQTTAGGFVIEVFEAAVRLLPYALSFEYVKAKSMPYDELVEAVGNGTFDAAVADITMTAYRSTHVDFTLPYTATRTAIAMVVPVRDLWSSKQTWVFLKPLHWDLWLVSAVFFLFIGLVVWAIEHRDNDEFRGPHSYQVGTLLYFGFSTLVFAHRENLKSNLSRLAVLVWVFVVLILQSSYTASLTSMLTVPQLEPTFADYGALLRSTEKVGIMTNSFIRNAMNAWGFPHDRIVWYPDAQSFHEALLNGSIGAIVNETPYLKIFLNTYRDNFTMTGQLNKTGGFGFAFPKGSPYVMDLSQAILKLTESDEMNLIERKWFGQDDGTAQGSGSFTSDSLSFGNFWGLFLITGATSLLCCAVHLFTFVATNRQELTPHLSWKGRLQKLVKLFDEKDPSSHTFRIKDDDGAVVRRNSTIVSSPLARTEVGSTLSVPHTSELSVETTSPATNEIELAAGGEERVEVAPNTEGSGENDRGR